MKASTIKNEYETQLPDVTKNRDAVSGERAVKAKSTEYLPPLSSMCCSYYDDENGYTQILQGATVSTDGQSSYKKYLSLAYFYGASSRTVDGLTGLIFRKKPLDAYSSQTEYLSHNTDGQGHSIGWMAKKACEEAFISPRSGLFVDYPMVEKRVSVAEAEQLNLRPKILHYQFESIINWHYDTIDNENRLSLLVLREVVETLKNRFEIEECVQYRVLEVIENVYYQSIYKANGEAVLEQTPVLVNGNTTNIIPFFFVEVGAGEKSVITDLVDANYNHYRFFADYAAKEHASAFPVFYETGVQGDDTNVQIGPGAKWTNPSESATFGILQTSSDGGSMRQYLLDMENRMAALGAEMLKSRIAGAESAEAKSLDQVAQNSTVGTIAMAVSQAFKRALIFCDIWLGGSGEEIEFLLNTDYNPSGMSGQDLTALVSAWQSGAISYETFYENLQKGERGNPDRTVEEEQSLIQNDGLGLDVE